MPDICKCSNSRCHKRDQCYRWMCIGSERQVYANFKPDEKTGECSHFISNTQHKENSCTH